MNPLQIECPPRECRSAAAPMAEKKEDRAVETAICTDVCSKGASCANASRARSAKPAGAR
jgi:hypothetical protein